jgi:hypothetical protein
LLLTNKRTYLTNPLIVLGCSFVINFAIFLMIMKITGSVACAPTDPGAAIEFASGCAIGVTFSLQAPIWYFLVVGVLSMTNTFPFCLAVSVSRREYWAGTMLAATGFSIGFTVLCALGRLIEYVTNGWWNLIPFFSIPWVTADGLLAQSVFTLALTLLAFMLGFVLSALWKRTGATGLIIAITALVAFLVTIAWVITGMEAWGSVADWFFNQTGLAIGMWLLAVDAVFAGVSYLIIRRTPA